MSGTFLVMGKTDEIVFAYYCAFFHVGSGHGHVLCSHVVAVVVHMGHGDVLAVIFSMYMCKVMGGVIGILVGSMGKKGAFSSIFYVY